MADSNLPIKVSLKDGRCRECKKQLQIIDAGEDTLTVECTSCGEIYDLETDAFNDGGAHYWPLARAATLFGSRE